MGGVRFPSRDIGWLRVANAGTNRSQGWEMETQLIFHCSLGTSQELALTAL